MTTAAASSTDVRRIPASTARVLSLSGLDRRDTDELLVGCATLVERLRDARIVITGATGWFGTWLLDALVVLNRVYALDLRIVAVSRVPEAFKRRFPALHDAAEIEWITADVRSGPLPLFGSVAYVLHAAAESHPEQDDPAATFDTIVAGTCHALDVASRKSARMLLVSSGAVYGRQPDDVERLDEAFIPAPEAIASGDAYARGKREAERLLLTAGHAGMAVVIARCFAFVGPHMPFDAHFAIGNFIRDALESEAIQIAGDGRPLRSYLYMTDLVEWLLTMLVSDTPSTIYNVGSADAVSIADLANRCVEIGGVFKPVRINGTGSGGRNYVPDVSRAQDDLGVRVRVPLDEAIARTSVWKRRMNAKLVHERASID